LSICTIAAYTPLIAVEPARPLRAVSRTDRARMVPTIVDIF
jgi:hypothetical protein